MTDFIGFPKIARLSREVIITEKIDGTCGVIFIGEDGEFLVGSKNRWITPEQDNFGFARWAMEHKEELFQLGSGRHFGEWWGSGIQRGYGLTKGERRFSLFNSLRWIEFNGNTILKEKQEYCPDCCHVVPILRNGVFDTDMVRDSLFHLKRDGSSAAPGFMKPEGIVVYHIAGNVWFKKTIEKDDEHKGKEKE